MDAFTVTPTKPKAAVEVQQKPAGSQGSAPGHKRRLHPPPPLRFAPAAQQYHVRLMGLQVGRDYISNPGKRKAYTNRKEKLGGIEKFGNTGLSHVDTHTLSQSVSPME